MKMFFNSFLIRLIDQKIFFLFNILKIILIKQNAFKK